MLLLLAMAFEITRDLDGVESKDFRCINRMPMVAVESFLAGCLLAVLLDVMESSLLLFWCCRGLDVPGFHIAVMSEGDDGRLID